MTKALSEADKSGVAHFDGIGDAHLDKLNPFTFAGIIPGKTFVGYTHVNTVIMFYQSDIGKPFSP